MRTKSAAILSLIGFALSTADLCLPTVSGYISGQWASCELAFRVFNLLEVSPWAWGMTLLPLWLLAQTFLRPPKAVAGMVTAALCAVALAGLFVGINAAKIFLLEAGAESIQYHFGIGLQVAVFLLCAVVPLTVKK